MIRMLSKFFATAVAFLLLAGCSTTESEPDSEPTFPVKSVLESSFSFDQFERRRALRAYARLKAQALFELVINREGNVVKIRTLRSNLDDFSTGAFKTHVQHMKFTPAPDNDPFPYRALFYPLKTTHEWIER